MTRFDPLKPQSEITREHRSPALAMALIVAVVGWAGLIGLVIWGVI